MGGGLFGPILASLSAGRARHRPRPTSDGVVFHFFFLILWKATFVNNLSAFFFCSSDMLA